MRCHIKRGGVRNRANYLKLKALVWDEVQKMDNQQIVIHGRTIQEIAQTKAIELGITNFKVLFYLNNF